MRWLLLLIVWVSSTTFAGPYTDAVKNLDFELLMQTYDDSKVVRLLEGHGQDLAMAERRAAAVMVSVGALDPEDIENRIQATKKLDAYIRVLGRNHPALMGRIGDVSLLPRMASRMAFAREYTELLSADELLEVLGEALGTGVITGYDLRMSGVYDDFPTAHTFIYSQSSLLHISQLVTLLKSEDIDGWVYVTPKVSAFLYRDDWGPASDAVVTLSGGIRVVQGREVAVLFQFDSRDDRLRFHEVITRFAKKDIKDEPGLIANAWWQPFYYTDDELAGFKAINLVVVASDEQEATLTVLAEKTQAVVDALSDKSLSTRVDRVWVNPPFFRFLNGDFK